MAWRERMVRELDFFGCQLGSQGGPFGRKYRIGLQESVVSWMLFCLSLGISLQPVFGDEGFSTEAAGDRHVAILSEQLHPWIDFLADRSLASRIRGKIEFMVEKGSQSIEFQFVRFDEDSFDLELVHDDYALTLSRRTNETRFLLPKHNRMFRGFGDFEAEDSLRPLGLLERLVSPGSLAKIPLELIAHSEVTDLVNSVIYLGGFILDDDELRWSNEELSIGFTNHNRLVQGKMGSIQFSLALEDSIEHLPPLESGVFKGEIIEIERAELERTVSRGIRRALEVFLPSPVLTQPRMRERRVDNGKLFWIDGHRVVVLRGSPEEVGLAHGQLLKVEAIRCIDSVLHGFGFVQTIITGRWFRQELEEAYARLKPFIPNRHLRETEALARAINVPVETLEAVNVFPELFHCSGFAVFGDATISGKLYHGRVLDYMTQIGLQDAATVFVIESEGMIPFVNIGYAGFIGSVSGMNLDQISLGEMGGGGEGAWDGVPMATLMRRALEECSSLEEVKRLWVENPRTCEYFYVFADGKAKKAVGVAATPEKVEFVQPGETHPRLGEGIPDAVVLSAGSRLLELRRRVLSRYGRIDQDVGQWLMCRPVAMDSNLHNVLFVPEDGLLYLSHADHQKTAAERPYSVLNLRELMNR